MHRVSPRCRITASVVFSLALVGLGLSIPLHAQTPSSSPFAVQPAKPSLTESITSGVKRGWDGLTRPFSTEPPATPAPDPTSLRSQGRPSPRLHVEVARLNEHSGRFDEAERHYQAALAMEPNDLSALLNYARLKDRQGNAAEAFELYRRAAQTHPQEASVYNYLGLHYDRRGMPNEAAATFAQAVQLKPSEPLYRNNLAHVLVQLNQLPAAYEHLHAVHGEAVAYYNMGYLLHQRGQRDAAVQHLAAAVRRNPNIAPARQLLAELAPNMQPAATGSNTSHVTTVPPVAARPHPASPSAPAHGPRPQFQPANPYAPSQLPAKQPQRDPLPQGPSHVAPPTQRAVPLPRHRSSTKLQQPRDIASDEVRLNAPYIQLTGATAAIHGDETEVVYPE